MQRLAHRGMSIVTHKGHLNMSIEAALAGLTEALTTNTEHLARVIAGQEAAMAKLEGVAPKTRTPRAAKAAEEAATSAGNEPAATESPVAAATTAPEPAAKVFTQDDLKAVAMEWRGSTEDEAARKKQNDLFVAIAAHLGVAKMTGPDGPQSSEQIKQAVFFIKRAMAGQKVDFAADYDFDGAPDQGVAVAEEDPFG